MARTESIIVGGGIQAGAPFTLGSLTRITSVTPPAIANSIAFQRTQGGLEVLTVGLQLGTDWPLPTTVTARLQVVGGFVSDTGATAGVAHDNTVIGRAASAPAAANSRNVVIGAQATAPAGATENVLIGFNNLIQAGIGSCVVIGAGNAQGATAATITTVIGSNNVHNNGFAGPGIGTGSTWNGAGVGIGNQQSSSAVNNWTMVGRSAQCNATGQSVYGDNARGGAGHDNAMAFGRNAVTIAANSLVFGAQNVGITLVLVGEGDTVAAPANVAHRYTDASGIDAQGANVAIRASRGTGNAATQGRLVLESGAVGATGVALQASTARLSVLPSTGGAAAPILAFDNFTNGAAAAAESVLNAPSANVAVYVPVLYNGANVGYLKIIPA